MKKSLIKKDYKIEYFECLRVIATIAVIIVHVAAMKWYDGYARSLSWNIFNIYDSAVRWCVPIFLMISGALFLSKEITISNV